MYSSIDDRALRSDNRARTGLHWYQVQYVLLIRTAVVIPETLNADDSFCCGLGMRTKGKKYRVKGGWRGHGQPLLVSTRQDARLRVCGSAH